MSSSSSLRWDSAVSSTAPDVMSSMTVASIDLTRVEAIQKKRLVTFVNHFIARTASFLNDFAREMDQRMEAMDNRVRNMENALTLVEFKLNSVPELGSEDVEVGS